MSTRKTVVWNVPNVLSMFRLLLVPAFWVLMLGAKHNYGALAVFALATCTDVLDGYIARKTKQITDFGKLLDPLADKLMTLSVLICLLIRKMIPWMPVALLLVKELIMVIGSACLYKRKIVVHSLFVGKFAQTAVCLALAMSFFEGIFAKMAFQPHTALLWIGVGAAYTALVVYVRSVLRQLRGVENTYNQRTEV